MDFTGAMLTGLAPDGGLFVPDRIPELPGDWREWGYVDAVAASLLLFGASDIDDLVADAAARFAHPEIAPIVEVGDRLVLELFWGPTLAFKDHALGVLGRLLAREVDAGVVIGATSGDTGSAAIEACRGFPNLSVHILFPEGRVTEFQRRQMTTVIEPNVSAIAVRGTFDDCQGMVKAAFTRQPGLLAANSINWARVAAQVGYYVHAGARIGAPFDVAVPTGNFGNVYACWLAKQMGVPIKGITIANNRNHGLHDRISGYPSDEDMVHPTIAPAMDVRLPSNLERFQGDLSTEFSASWSSDDEIRETMRSVLDTHTYLLDPHTATAWRAARPAAGRPCLVVATAHPVKFSEVVEMATGSKPELPPRFADIFDRPESVTTIDADPSAFLELIR